MAAQNCNKVTEIPRKIEVFAFDPTILIKRYWIAVLISYFCALVQGNTLTVTTSYKTSHRCKNGSYVMISGDDLTLIYDYKLRHDQIQTLQLHESTRARIMFNFDNTTGDGKPSIINIEQRLKKYLWTYTGIEFTIEGISAEKDQGKYRAEVEIPNGDYGDATIDVPESQILDPPSTVKVTVNSGAPRDIALSEGFGTYRIEASAESDKSLACSSVKIVWTIEGEGYTEALTHSCESEDPNNSTDCPFVIKEGDLEKGSTIKLKVYAEQYGVQSSTEEFDVSYEGGIQANPQILEPRALLEERQKISDWKQIYSKSDATGAPLLNTGKALTSFVLYLTTGPSGYERDTEFCRELDLFNRTTLVVWKKGSQKTVYKEHNQKQFELMIGSKRLPTTKEVRALLNCKDIQKRVDNILAQKMRLKNRTSHDS